MEDFFAASLFNLWKKNLFFEIITHIISFENSQSIDIGICTGRLTNIFSVVLLQL